MENYKKMSTSLFLFRHLLQIFIFFSYFLNFFFGLFSKEDIIIIFAIRVFYFYTDSNVFRLIFIKIIHNPRDVPSIFLHDRFQMMRVIRP